MYVEDGDDLVIVASVGGAPRDPLWWPNLKAKPEERELVEKSYNATMGEEVYPHKQYPSLAGIQTILDAMVKEEPKAKEAKPEDFVDARFVKELDDSGFINNLYKGKGN